MGRDDRITFSYDPAKLEKLYAFYGIDGEFQSERHSKFIDEIARKLDLYKSSQAASEQPSEQKPDMTEIQCSLRISLSKSESGYGCVNKPPRVVKLDSLEICRVCQALFKGLDDHTKALGSQVSEPVRVGEQPPLITTHDGRQVEDLRSPDYKLRKMCPPEIEKLLYFEQAPEKEAVRIRTKAWLEARDFKTVSQWILSVNGEYVSKGKDSHFLVPYKAITQASKT